VLFQGTIVRGEWIQVFYPKQRMESFVLARNYGSMHCYGYGPGCSPIVETVQTFYRFDSFSNFTVAQGQFIEIPQDAQKLELYFYSNDTKIKLGYQGIDQIVSTGPHYDSQDGKNYHFNF
jgi:hypothetical protein